MPWTATEPSLPFAPGSHTSLKAALSAVEAAPRKRAQLRALYEAHGALSDPEVEMLTGWPRSTICSVRASLMHKLVKDGTAKSKWGKDCDRWRLAR